MRDRELLELAANRLLNQLKYTPETGEFMWLPKLNCEHDAKRWNSRYANKMAGSLDASNGYINIIYKLGDKKLKLKAHRIAWLFITGSWPLQEIDHINQIRSDNRASNLRDVSKSINQRNASPQLNNTSGYVGVTWHKQHKKWYAQAVVSGKRHFLGLFSDVNEAGKVAALFRFRNGFTENHIGIPAAEIGKTMKG